MAATEAPAMLLSGSWGCQPWGAIRGHGSLSVVQRGRVWGLTGSAPSSGGLPVLGMS